MSPRGNSAGKSAAKHGGSTLFAAAHLDQTAPRPLADKLRPTRLAEVVGQDHLLPIATEHIGTFGHEVYSAKDDVASIGFCCRL